MLTLVTFRLVRKHLLGALSGIFIGAAMARLIGWLWPSARPIAFIVVSLFFVLAELSVAFHELHKGPLSTGIIVLDFMPFLLLGAGVTLFLGQLATQWPRSDWGGLIVFFGIYYCILMVIAGVKYTVQDRNLNEDLEHPAPNTSEEDQKKLRKYMHPYI